MVEGSGVREDVGAAVSVPWVMGEMEALCPMSRKVGDSRAELRTGSSFSRQPWVDGGGCCLRRSSRANRIMSSFSKGSD